MRTLNVPGPKARSLIERDLAVVSPSYPRGYPFVMDHGAGPKFGMSTEIVSWISQPASQSLLPVTATQRL